MSRARDLRRQIHIESGGLKHAPGFSYCGRKLGQAFVKNEQSCQLYTTSRMVFGMMARVCDDAAASKLPICAPCLKAALEVTGHGATGKAPRVRNKRLRKYKEDPAMLADQQVLPLTAARKEDNKRQADAKDVEKARFGFQVATVYKDIPSFVHALPSDVRGLLREVQWDGSRKFHGPCTIGYAEMLESLGDTEVFVGTRGDVGLLHRPTDAITLRKPISTTDGMPRGANFYHAAQAMLDRILGRCGAEDSKLAQGSTEDTVDPRFAFTVSSRCLTLRAFVASLSKAEQRAIRHTGYPSLEIPGSLAGYGSVQRSLDNGAATQVFVGTDGQIGLWHIPTNIVVSWCLTINTSPTSVSHAFSGAVRHLVGAINKAKQAAAGEDQLAQGTAVSTREKTLYSRLGGIQASLQIRIREHTTERDRLSAEICKPCAEPGALVSLQAERATQEHTIRALWRVSKEIAQVFDEHGREVDG